MASSAIAISQRGPLSRVPILIADRDRELSRVVGGMLKAVGFASIRYAHCSQTVVASVQEHHADIILSELTLEPIDGLSILRRLRNANDPTIKYLPVVMLSARASADNILAARDFGANYFIAKPFSVRTVLSRLREIIEQPRPFVITPDFKGPDRRLRPSNVSNDNRDTSPHRLRSITCSKEDAARVTSSAVRLVKPDYALRRKIGLEIPLDKIFAEEAIEAAQKAVDESQKAFLSWLAEDCRGINKTAQALLRGSLPMAEGIADVMDRSLTIKARAGTFGYSCAAAVADSLHVYGTEALLANSYEPLVVAKHTEGLQTILANNIHGGGGDVGKSLLESLQQLCAKHLKQ